MYGPDFYQAEDQLAMQAATTILPDLLPITSLVDVGCGTGAWPYTAQQAAIPSVGIDWEVPPDQRRPILYMNADLAHGCPDLTGWDLAVCLEVAEHLPDTAAPHLVAALAKAGRVLFSAATPGQPGVGHVNCQPHDYWHELFLTHGLQPTHVGPNYKGQIADFYCRNLFMYERSSA